VVAAGAAGEDQDETDNTSEWGWIVAAILAVALLAGAIIWWRREHPRSPRPGGPAAGDG
jgi:hypothetical protein